MKIKRISKLMVNSSLFTVRWDKNSCGGSFNYGTLELIIGTDNSHSQIFNVICHELWEIVAIETQVRLRRPDVRDDYIFVYDHRQLTTMASMFAGLVSQFIT